MTKLIWSKAGDCNPDPARVGRENISSQMSDRDIANFKRKHKMKNQVPAAREPRKALTEVLPETRGKKLKTVGDRIRIVWKSGKPDANEFIRETAIRAMLHAEKTGDCGYIANLISALPSTTRQQRLAEWISRFSPVCIGPGKNGGVKAFLRKEGATGTSRFDYVGARRTPFQ